MLRRLGGAFGGWSREIRWGDREERREDNLPEVHRLQTDRTVPHPLEPGLSGGLVGGGRAGEAAAGLSGEVGGAEGRPRYGLLEDGPGGAEHGGCGGHLRFFDRNNSRAQEGFRG